MSTPNKLTRNRKAELIRRRTLGIRCEKWLPENDQRAIAKRFDVDAKMVNKIHKGRRCKALDEATENEIRRLARHAATVGRIQRKNCRYRIKKDFNISEERIDKLCPPPEKRVKEKTAVDRFLTMILTANPANEWCYYGRCKAG